MLSSGVPTKFPIPFASGAGAGYIRPIPVASQIGVNPGFASLTDGFVPLNMTPASAGGIPPFGQDENGILNQITAWIQWSQAGGPVAWDATFSGQIGGYPAGAAVASATTLGLYWLSTVDNNTSNPDAGGVGWKPHYLGIGGEEFYADTGAPNAMVITASPPDLAYKDGQTFFVYPSHANTAATTLKVNSLAAVPVVNNADGSALVSGSVAVGQLMMVTYVGGSFLWVNAPTNITQAAADNSIKLATTAYADRAAALALAVVDTYAGAIYGLTLSNTPAFTTTRVSSTVGACRDSTNSVAINVTAPMSKDLTATWAAGDTNGGKLDAAALANGQTWFVFALVNPVNGAYDFAYSQSPTAPPMTVPIAAGFTKFRRIGSVVLETSSTAIRQFIQVGDWFFYKVRSADYGATANGGSVAYYRPISVPVGIVVEALLLLQSSGTQDGNPYFSGVYNPALGSVLPFGGPTQWAQIRRITVYAYPGTWICYGYTVCTQYCDASGHVYTGCSDPTDFLALGVLGWRDQRGRFYPDP